jgi:hypothetical protein
MRDCYLTLNMMYSDLVWKVKFVGNVQDENGNEKLVRIMETPSLFVLEQDL